jgi:hypothetical protein
MGVSRKITLSGAGQSHPMFEGKPATFDAFTSHKDEVLNCNCLFIVFELVFQDLTLSFCR